MMFWFAYGLMNRSIDKLVLALQSKKCARTRSAMATLLATYAQQNARAEAVAIAASPEVAARLCRSRDSPEISTNSSSTNPPCRADSPSRSNGNAEASFNAPAPWASR